MGSLGNLIVHIGADIKDFVKNMDQVERRLKRGLGPDAVGLSQGLVTAFAGLTAGLGAVGVASVKMAADMEQNRIAFTTMLGSAEKADAFLREMAQFAAATPFELPGLLESSKKLLAFGFQAKQIKPMLTAIGDAVAGLGGGTAEIDRVTLALGQMQAKGKVSAEEMNQLAELGIPGWKFLADAIGISIPEAMKRAEAGTLSAATAIPALVQGMNQKFGGMMEKQSESLLGLWSTAKDNIGAVLRTLGDNIIATFDLKAKLAGANKWLTEFANQVQNGGIRQALEKMVPESLRTGIIMVAGALAGAMAPALGLVALNAAKALVPLLPWITLGAALAGTVYLIVKNWDNLAVRFATVMGIVGGAIILFSKLNVGLQLWGATTKVVTALQAVLNAVMSANPIGLVIVAIGALVAAGVVLYKNWDTVKQVALNTWGAIKAGILTAVAAVVEAWGKFVGVFNKDGGDRIKASADAMRKQAEAERDLVEQRKSNAQAAENAESEAEERRQQRAQQKARAQEEHAKAAQQTDTDVWATMSANAESGTKTKEKYLDEFETAFSRAQDDAVTAFERRQEAEVSAMERTQQAQMTQLERAQQDEMTALKESQAERLRAVEDTLADETTAFKRELDDQKGYQEEVWADEATTFKRSQEDQMDAFKDRMDQETKALKDRQEAELEATDKEYAARKKSVQDQIDAIKGQEQAKQNANKIVDLQKGVSQAKNDVTRAEMTGDSASIFRARQKLAEAEQKLQDEKDKQARDARVAALESSLKDIDAEARQKTDALKKAHAEEQDKLKADQEERMKQFQRQQEDEATHFKLVQDLRKVAYERMQQDQLEAFQRGQDAKLEQFKKDQEEEQKRLEQFHEDVKSMLKTAQDDEMTALKQRQQDFKEQYQRELDDLKTSLAEKLGAQQQYVNDISKLQGQMAAMAPSGGSGAGIPAGGSANDVPKFAAGGVVSRPTLGIFGEAGSEAITPLSWLSERMAAFADRVVGGVSVRMPSSPRMPGAVTNVAASSPVVNNTFAPGSIVIPAKDLAEMKTVTDFFDRIAQSARSLKPA